MPQWQKFGKPWESWAKQRRLEQTAAAKDSAHPSAGDDSEEPEAEGGPGALATAKALGIDATCPRVVAMCQTGKLEDARVWKTVFQIASTVGADGRCPNLPEAFAQAEAHLAHHASAPKEAQAAIDKDWSELQAECQKLSRAFEASKRNKATTSKNLALAKAALEEAEVADQKAEEAQAKASSQLEAARDAFSAKCQSTKATGQVDPEQVVRQMVPVLTEQDLALLKEHGGQDDLQLAQTYQKTVGLLQEDVVAKQQNASAQHKEILARLQKAKEAQQAERDKGFDDEDEDMASDPSSKRQKAAKEVADETSKNADAVQAAKAKEAQEQLEAEKIKNSQTVAEQLQKHMEQLASGSGQEQAPAVAEALEELLSPAVDKARRKVEIVTEPIDDDDEDGWQPAVDKKGQGQTECQG